MVAFEFTWLPRLLLLWCLLILLCHHWFLHCHPCHSCLAICPWGFREPEWWVQQISPSLMQGGFGLEWSLLYTDPPACRLPAYSMAVHQCELANGRLPSFSGACPHGATMLGRWLCCHCWTQPPLLSQLGVPKWVWVPSLFWIISNLKCSGPEFGRCNIQSFIQISVVKKPNNISVDYVSQRNAYAMEIYILPRVICLLNGNFNGNSKLHDMCNLFFFKASLLIYFKIKILCFPFLWSLRVPGTDLEALV